jgi:hypothetical protein
MARAQELINVMNKTERNSVVAACKREIKTLGYKCVYDSYVGWILTW